MGAIIADQRLNSAITAKRATEYHLSTVSHGGCAPRPAMAALRRVFLYLEQQGNIAGTNKIALAIG